MWIGLYSEMLISFFLVHRLSANNMTGMLDPKLVVITMQMDIREKARELLKMRILNKTDVRWDDDSLNTGPNVTIAEWNYHCFGFQFTFYTVITGIICLLGLIGNTISLVVLRNDRSNNVALLLLQALSVADNILLSISFVILSVLFGLLPMILTPQVALNISFYGLKYLEPFAYMSHTATIWMTVLLAINRYIAVCMPLNAGDILTMRKARIQVYCVFIFSILFNAPRFCQWNLTFSIDKETNTKMVIPEVSSIGHGTIFAKIYTNAMYSILVVLLPLFFLIVLNGKLVREINLMRERRSSLTHVSPNREENVTTIMVVIIVNVIMGHLPDRILQIVKTHSSTSFRDCSSVQYYLVALANLLIILNSSTNFLVYYLLRRSFRKILVAKLCHLDDRRGSRSQSVTLSLQTEIRKISSSSCTEATKLNV